jgi:hypothetical protein
MLAEHVDVNWNEGERRERDTRGHGHITRQIQPKPIVKEQ